jgi:hypothetical protein
VLRRLEVGRPRGRGWSCPARAAPTSSTTPPTAIGALHGPELLPAADEVGERARAHRGPAGPGRRGRAGGGGVAGSARAPSGVRSSVTFSTVTATVSAFAI